MRTLTEIANHYGTDKGTESFNQHGYTEHYARYFDALRSEPLKMLEIGVWQAEFAGAPQGASLSTWSDYFPRARIYGFDIVDCSRLDGDRITTWCGDQSNRGDWRKFIESCGGDFDIIIDDAIHASKFQQISLGFLFPYLKPGGLYFIEDLDWQPPFENPRDVKTLELVRQFDQTGRIESEFILEAESAYLSETVQSIDVFEDKLCVLKKNSSAE